jgi:L-asparagine oxygenase
VLFEPTAITDVGGGSDEGEERFPILYGERKDPLRQLRHDALCAFRPRVAQALCELAARLRAACRPIVLRPGDMLFLNNRRAVHGRAGFTARYDGEDRWLKRVVLMADLGRAVGELDRRRRVIVTTDSG